MANINERVSITSTKGGLKLVTKTMGRSGKRLTAHTSRKSLCN